MDETLPSPPSRFLKVALRGPQDPLGRFFEPRLFMISKSSQQDLSNEGLKFILSPLEPGHQAAQTYSFFDRFQNLASQQF